MVYRFAVLCIAASVVLAFAYEHISAVSQLGAFDQFNNLTGSHQNILLNLRNGATHMFEVIKGSSSFVPIVLCLIAFVVLSFFLFSFCDIAKGNVLYMRLSSKCKVSYSGSFFKKLWLAFKFAIFKTVYFLVVTTIILVVFSFSTKLLDIDGFFGTISPYIILVIFLVMLTFFTIPTNLMIGILLTRDEKVCLSFFRAIKLYFKGFFKLFIFNFFALLFVVFINYVAASVFIGVFLSITLPTSFVFYATFSMISFFEISGNRYWLSEHKIVNPKKDEEYDTVKNLKDLL